MIEIIEKRTLTTKHFKNDNGSITTEIHLNPIHYKTESGQLEDIDLTIIPEINWEFEYSLKKNSFRSYFNDATDLENFTLAGFELINSNGVSRWLNYKLINAVPTSNSYEGNKFKYISVFPNVDLEYTVTSEKLKENIIVHNSTALQPFTFSLKFDDGLRIELQEDNSIFFFDVDTGEKLWEIAKPYAVDSSENQLRTDNVIYTLGKQTYNGVEYDSITVELQDTEFLNNAIFPIQIDPTVTITTVQNDGYWGDNGGGSSSTLQYMWVGNYYDGENAFNYNSYIVYDISSIPSNAVITSAYAKVYQEYNGGYTDNLTIHQATEALRGLATLKKPLATVSVSNEDGYKNFTITSAVSEWVANPSSNYGVILTGPTTLGHYHRFTTQEGTSDPRLVITYNAPPTVPTFTSPILNDELDSVHSITWTPSTDDGTAQASLQYTIDLSIDNGVNWQPIVALTSAGASAYPYDFSNIEESAICLLRIKAYDGSAYGDYGYSEIFTISHGKSYIKVGGQYVKSKIYLKQNSVYIEVKAYRKVNGVYEKM